jgi:hypothetical protein
MANPRGSRTASVLGAIVRCRNGIIPVGEDGKCGQIRYARKRGMRRRVTAHTERRMDRFRFGLSYRWPAGKREPKNASRRCICQTSSWVTCAVGSAGAKTLNLSSPHHLAWHPQQEAGFV